MKKTIISLLLVAVLAFGAGFGTLAYYTDNFKSEGNTITTAKFDPSKDGEWTQTNIIGADFAPGDTAVFRYPVALNNTEVPVKYIININNERVQPLSNDSNNNDLFREGTPIVRELFVLENDELIALNETVKGSNKFEFIPTGRDAEFILNYSWPWDTNTTNDINFANNEGTVNVSIEVQQIKGYEVKTADGSQYLEWFIAFKQSKTPYRYSGDIALKNLGDARITELTLVAYDANHNKIADAKAASSTLELVNNNLNITGSILYYDATKGESTKFVSEYWLTDVFAKGEPAYIKAFFKLSNSDNIYCVQNSRTDIQK